MTDKEGSTLLLWYDIFLINSFDNFAYTFTAFKIYTLEFNAALLCASYELLSFLFRYETTANKV